MPIGDIVIHIFVFALDAVWCVRDLCNTALIDGHIDAKIEHRIAALPSQRGDERVVGVEAQRGIGAVGDPDADVLQCVCHLAIAVELVAEHIGHDNHLRIDQTG